MSAAQTVALRSQRALCIVMRFSPRLMAHVLSGLDDAFRGFKEALLPQLCAVHGFSLRAFAPELLGAVGPSATKLTRLVEDDVRNGTAIAIEPRKLYHPVKV